MPVLNITCPICTEVFGNSEDIYSTSCGHVFHFACMRDWQSRSTSCPQCRSYGPTTHKLFLSFDDDAETPKATEELEIKLKSSVEKIQRLYDQIQEGDINFLHLQEQYNRSEECIRGMEENVRQLRDSETNFLHLQAQYTETEEHNRELEESVQVLTIENEYKQKELSLKSLEIDRLKSTLDNVECQTSEIYLNEKIKILEQRLKHVTAELEKEISNSTQLSIEKMKLNSYIERTKLEENKEENDKIGNKNLSIRNKNSNKNNNSKQQRMSAVGVKMGISPIISSMLISNIKEEKVQDSATGFAQNANDITSVVIKQFPLNQISYPLENIIIALASIMNLSISHEDLGKVNIMEKRVHLPKKVTLFAQFKSLDLKIKFLSNKNQLKKNPLYESLIIREHADDFTNEVFRYANKKLREIGYCYIACKNNQVIANRGNRDFKSIRITSKNHVDELVRNEPKIISPILYEDEVDECYYKK